MVVGVAAGGQTNDLHAVCRARHAPNVLCGLQSVHVWHEHVHQHHIDRMVLQPLQGLFA